MTQQQQRRRRRQRCVYRQHNFWVSDAGAAAATNIGKYLWINVETFDRQSSTEWWLQIIAHKPSKHTHTLVEMDSFVGMLCVMAFLTDCDTFATAADHKIPLFIRNFRFDFLNIFRTHHKQQLFKHRVGYCYIAQCANREKYVFEIGRDI